MAKNKYDYDLIIIGGGSSGAIVADIVARAKWKVAIIENNKIGGELLVGSGLSSKALLHSASVFDSAKHYGPKLGLRSSSISYNYPSVRNYKDSVVKNSGLSGRADFLKRNKVDIYKGNARFIDKNQVTVDRKHLSAKKFLIATGSVPSDGGVIGLDKVTYLKPSDAVDLIRPPKSLFVIGAGATGCEFTELFSAFGTKVYLADESSRILPGEDQEASEIIEKNLKSKRGVEVMSRTKVIRVVKEGIMVRVYYLRGSQEHSVKVDQVLLAAGRSPALDIGLENAKVDYSQKGVETDEFLITSQPHIFAAGDVLGRFPYAHTSVYESKVVANNLLFPRQKIAVDYTAIPRVTFLKPEVASVGISETDCLKRDLPIKMAVVPLNIVAKSAIENIRDGFVKVIVDKRGYLIGATVVCPSAGEIIHTLTLAIKAGLTAKEVSEMVYAFPTWSEAVRVACAKVRQ